MATAVTYHVEPDTRQLLRAVARGRMAMTLRLPRPVVTRVIGRPKVPVRVDGRRLCQLEYVAQWDGDRLMLGHEHGAAVEVGRFSSVA